MQEARVLGNPCLLMLSVSVCVSVPPHFRSESAGGAISCLFRIAYWLWAQRGGGGGWLQTNVGKLLSQHKFTGWQWNRPCNHEGGDHGSELSARGLSRLMGLACCRWCPGRQRAPSTTRHTDAGSTQTPKDMVRGRMG